MSNEVQNNTTQNNAKHQHFVQHTTYASGADSIKNTATPYLQNKPSYTPAIFKACLGILGFGIFGIISLLSLIASSTMPAIITALISCASLFLLIKSFSSIGLISKFHTYGRLVGDAQYVEVSALASQAGASSDAVCKNLSKMISKGFFQDASLSPQQDVFFVTGKGRQEYLLSGGTDVSDADMEGMWKEGRIFLRFIDKFIARLAQNDQMQAKAIQLKNTISSICNEVQDNPEKAEELRRATNYYLPTTQKLLASYANLQQQGDIQSENIINTRKEIFKAMDMVNEGFNKIYDDLYQDTALDISSDVAVMQTMMKQDGLSENTDFQASV